MSGPLIFSRRSVNRALLATAVGLLADRVGLRVATPIFDFAIAGGFYHGLLAAQGALQAGTMLVLRREPDNVHDADAIAVERDDGLMLGYVPRAANTPVARLLDQGWHVRAEVIGTLTVGDDEDIPADLVFTSFMTGDPLIRLTVEGAGL